MWAGHRVLVSVRRDSAAARRFFASRLSAGQSLREVTTDRAPTLARAIDELIPGALHDTEQYANNRIERDHGRLKARLRPMRDIKTKRTASTLIRGHAFIQNLRRGHYELGTETTPEHRSQVVGAISFCSVFGVAVISLTPRDLWGPDPGVPSKRLPISSCLP
ncbi:MAG: DDE domain-containing protein [Planctomycetaceae bacterium]|nr:MAG: DDE domain-containing protein [Planctomycetaceae bacterium]